MVVTKGSVRFGTKETIFLNYILEDYKTDSISLKAKMGNWGTEWGKCGK